MGTYLFASPPDGGNGEWIIYDDCMTDCPGFDEIANTCTSFGGDDPTAECFYDACEVAIKLNYG